MRFQKLLFLFLIATIINSSCDDESPSNDIPNCIITNPVEGDEFGLGALIEITVDAEDEDGSIVEVRYYIDDKGVGSSNSFPFSYSWNTIGEELGAHIIKAKAFDDKGGTEEYEINISLISTSSIVDSRDNEIYLSVLIGEQWWMAENLNYNANGSYVYENISNYTNDYGRLYNWNAAMTACPDGWHLPSDYEWKQLEMHLGMSEQVVENYSYRGSNEGGKLKGIGTTYWESPNYGATNQSAFNALPGGGMDDYNNFFFNLRNHAYFWSSSENGYFYALIRGLGAEYQTVLRDVKTKDNAYSVRCIKD
jgi:uncharacterized protein (TIGR02145 family)